MNTYAFILNPKASKGKGAKLIPKLRAAISRHNLKAELLLTEKAGHAVELAKHAPASIIVAVGGDGTVNEVANGVIGSPKTLAIIPNGSGNDFVKSLSIPPAFDLAFEKILAGNLRVIDCGVVETSDLQGTSNSVSRCFVNGVGIGFDAAVAERTHQIKFLAGTALYVLAVFQTLGKYHSPEFSLTIDSQSSNSRNLLIAIGNGICAGGGFYLTPKAKVDDGLLDICLIEEMSVGKILRLIPSVMKGQHEGRSGVSFDKAKSIRVSAQQRFFVHADGEIVGRNTQQVRVRIIEKALNVIA